LQACAHPVLAINRLVMSTAHPFTLDIAPTEIVEEIYRHLDLSSALCLAGTCSRFHHIYDRNEKRFLRLLALKEESLQGFQDRNFVDLGLSLAEAMLKNKSTQLTLNYRFRHCANNYLKQLNVFQNGPE
jgi:hypothetical protein